MQMRLNKSYLFASQANGGIIILEGAIRMPRYIDFDRWYQEGVSLYGYDTDEWKYVCPSCGFTQSVSLVRQRTEQLGVLDLDKIRYRVLHFCYRVYNEGSCRFSSQKPPGNFELFVVCHEGSHPVFDFRRPTILRMVHASPTEVFTVRKRPGRPRKHPIIKEARIKLS